MGLLLSALATLKSCNSCLSSSSASHAPTCVPSRCTPAATPTAVRVKHMPCNLPLFRTSHHRQCQTRLRSPCRVSAANISPPSLASNIDYIPSPTPELALYPGSAACIKHATTREKTAEGKPSQRAGDHRRIPAGVVPAEEGAGLEPSVWGGWTLGKAMDGLGAAVGRVYIHRTPLDIQQRKHTQ